MCHAGTRSPRHNGEVNAKAKSTKKVAKKRTSGVQARVITAVNQFWQGYGKRAAFIVGGVLAVPVVFTVVVFPLRDYFEQKSMVADKRAEFETLADANEQLQNEVNALKTPEGIRNAARAQLGYVLPGEQRLQMVQMPELPTDLPAQWPYSMVRDIMRVRTESVVKSGGPLSPLSP